MYLFKVCVADRDSMVRVLELAIEECDVQFIKYLVTEQSVDVKGKPFVYTKQCTVHYFSSTRKLSLTFVNSRFVAQIW